MRSTCCRRVLNGTGFKRYCICRRRDKYQVTVATWARLAAAAEESIYARDFRLSGADGLNAVLRRKLQPVKYG